MKTNTTDDVFGVHRNLPLNYVVRPYADELLINNLSRGRHLVIYGSSKQGKTSLRKHCLVDTDYITIHCSNKWTVADINSAILKSAGFEITLSENKSHTGKHKIFAKAKLGFMGNEAEGGAEAGRESTTSTQTAPLEIDQEDVNDIITALKSINFKQFIVLEDFHYLSVESQIDFSVALKAYHENSPITFIVVGVWLEENRLSVYNGDLTGRIFPINADRWDDKELLQVISDGAALIGVDFDENFVKALLDGCNSSVSLVQEVCHQLCINNQIFQTRLNNPTIGSESDATRLLKWAVDQHTGRYNSFINGFSEGFQSTTLEMHKWLLYPVLNSSPKKLLDGLRQKEIRETLHSVHPRKEELNSGNVTQALKSCASLQVKKGIKPIIFDYDETNLRLRVVDRAFLIWLEHQNRSELLNSIDLPNN
ncbi:hypothetical protein P0Y35_18800 [Kiritimatiellaeota bacterium B1221]|nr:hypothetical protein [Kiritimatiellaeota bacterium B1221]